MVNEKYRGSLETIGYNIVTIVAILILWSVVSWLAESSYFPSIGRIWAAFIHLAMEGDIDNIRLWWHILNSLLRILAGFGAGRGCGASRHLHG